MAVVTRNLPTGHTTHLDIHACAEVKQALPMDETKTLNALITKLLAHVRFFPPQFIWFVTVLNTTILLLKQYSN